MTSEPPSGQRRHPLERPPAHMAPPPPSPEGEGPRRLVAIQFPRVAPTATYVLIALNVLIFVVRALSPSLDTQLYLWGANNPQLVLFNGEYYRLLTSMFLHAGVYTGSGALVMSNALHIILNMYILYSVGQQLEALFGHVRFLIIYLAGGLLGSVFSAALSDMNVMSVGASGAVFAILGAEFMFYYRHRTLLGPRATAQMRSLVMWAVINFFYGALTSVAGTRLRIDNWGHLGGLVGGLALAWFLTPVFMPKRSLEMPQVLTVEDTNPLERRWPIVLAYVAALLLVVLLAGNLRSV
jgi:rhomboid protease GluP